MSYSFITRCVEFVAAVARYHKLSFKYWLFEVKPQLYARLYEFNTFGSVEATSKHTVGFIQDVVSKDIGNSRGWKIEVRVYEVRRDSKKLPFSAMFTITALGET